MNKQIKEMVNLKIGIVGAGATGLMAGLRLSQKGHSVTVFEAEGDVGGLVGTVDVGEEPLEKYYHHIFTNDTRVVDVINELGLTDSLKWVSPKSGLYINGTLYPFSTPMDLIKFKEIPFIERILLGLLVVRSKFVKDWKALEEITAREWVEKFAGKNAYTKFWGPLLQSKFDIDADEISAVWLWNKFKLRGSTRSNNTNGKEMFGYLEGSFVLIYKRLAEEIEKNGGLVLRGARVNDIVKNTDESISIKANGQEDEYKFDKVIFTPAPLNLIEMGVELPKEYKESVRQVKYKSNICMMLELKASISPYYWVTVAEKNFPFVLVIEHTNLMSKEKYGSTIVYLSRYLDETNPLYSYTDDKIADVFLRGLKGMFPTFKKNDVKGYKIFKSRFAQPVVLKRFSDSILEYETPIPNLYIANMSQIYPEDRGQNYSLRLGETIADVVGK